MGKIKILSQDDIKKIAAGEVVERPLNVVKELVENAIDAKAKNISIYLKDGGKSLIKVEDDGIGMSFDDARLSIENHATSKINNALDISYVNTYGFRGEALSSISSVSLMTIITKDSDSNVAIKLSIKDGKIVNESFIPCNIGTQVIIENIFYNLPARLKFLKSKDNELRSIINIFKSFCFSNIDISFNLYSEDKVIYNCPAVDNLKNRFVQLYDNYLIDNLKEIENQNYKYNDNISLYGYITGLNYFKYDRNSIYIFVNNRLVKNSRLISSFIKGYDNGLIKSKFPAGVLLLSVNKNLIDINVHPRKEEISFLNPKLVENFIENSIKSTISKDINKSISVVTNSFDNNFTGIKFNEFYYNQLKCNEVIENSVNNNLNDNLNNKKSLNINNDLFNIDNTNIDNISLNLNNNYSFKDNLEYQNKNQYLDKIIFNNFNNIDNINTNINNINKNLNLIDDFDYNNIILGQLFKTYIVVDNSLELLLIDQHAAHERILYESFLNKSFKLEVIENIFDNIIQFDKYDICLIEKYISYFKDVYIDIDIIGSNEILVKKMPIFYKKYNLKEVILDVISKIRENKDNLNIDNIIQESIFINLSCKGAIKSGDILSKNEMLIVIKKLYSLKNNLTCPHSRPIIYKLSKFEIEKKFKRDYR